MRNGGMWNVCSFWTIYTLDMASRQFEYASTNNAIVVYVCKVYCIGCSVQNDNPIL
jgi:hypothetical protein